jgi:hypothetical protein
MNRGAPGNRPPRLGEGDTCPFCGSTSGVTDSDDGYSCLVCGSPRVILDGVAGGTGASRNLGAPAVLAEKQLLLKSKSLRLKRAAWGAAGGISAAIGVFAGLVTAILAGFIGLGRAPLAFAVAAVLLPLLFSVVAFRRARRATVAADESLEMAQVAVALRASAPGADANDLAKKLHVPLARAEELLALAQVERFLAEPEGAPKQKIRVEAASGDTELMESDADPEGRIVMGGPKRPS